MKTTRTAYVLVQREKRDADGKAIRGEKILRPEKAEDGYAYIDLTCLEKGTRREAVLEQEQKFIIEAGLKFADVEVVFPFPQT